MVYFMSLRISLIVDGSTGLNRGSVLNGKYALRNRAFSSFVKPSISSTTWRNETFSVYFVTIDLVGVGVVWCAKPDDGAGLTSSSCVWG